jgi:hypothetical protein
VRDGKYGKRCQELLFQPLPPNALLCGGDFGFKTFNVLFGQQEEKEGERTGGGGEGSIFLRNLCFSVFK